MSMRNLFCPDPLAGFEKMAGFQICFRLIIKRFHHNLDRTSNLSSEVGSCGYNLLMTLILCIILEMCMRRSDFFSRCIHISRCVHIRKFMDI